MKHPRHSAPGYGGYLGHAYDPFLITQDANSPDFSIKTFDAPENVDLTRLGGRKRLLRSLDLFQSEQEQKFEFAQTHDVFTEKALALPLRPRPKMLSICPASLRSSGMIMVATKWGRGCFWQGDLSRRVSVS